MLAVSTEYLGKPCLNTSAIAYFQVSCHRVESSTMLITLKTKSYADITMFGDVAIKLLQMTGHSGTVPGKFS